MTDTATDPAVIGALAAVHDVHATMRHAQSRRDIVLVTAFEAGASHRQIAMAAGMPNRHTAAQALHRARKRLVEQGILPDVEDR